MRISSRAVLSLACAVVAMTWGGLAPLAAQPAARTLITNYSSDDIGFDATTWASVQDQAGVIYIAGHTLISFDGERWKSLPMEEWRTMRGIALDGNDRLWVGAINEIGWYDRTDTGWKYNSLREFIPPEDRAFASVWRIFLRGREVFFFAQEKVLRWDGQKITVWRLPSLRPLRGLRVGDDIFVQENESGLYLLRDSGPELVVPGSVLQKAIITRLEKRPEGGWLALTNAGFRILTPEKSELWPCEANDYIQRWKPTDTLKLADGRLVISMQGGGLIVVRSDGGVDQALSTANGLTSDEISGMGSTRDGSIWLFGFQYISRISILSGSTLFLDPVPPAQPYQTMLVHQGSILVASRSTLYRLDGEGQRFQELAEPRGSINGLESTPAGAVVSSVEKVYRLAGDRSEVIYRPRRDTFVTLHLPGGGFLVSENRSITHVSLQGESKTVVDLLPDDAESLALDARGLLWMGQEIGTVAVAPFDPALGHPAHARGAMDILGQSTPGRSLVRNGVDGDVVVLSNHGWIVRDREGQPQPVAIENYPTTKVLSASPVSAEGTLWVLFAGRSPAKGMIGRISTTDLQPRWEPLLVDGLERVGLPTSVRVQPTRAGTVRVWVVGGRGILSQEVKGRPTAPRPHPPILSATARSSKSADLHAIAEPLPYSTETVVFEFAAPEFNRRPQLQIETRVDGLDSEWAAARADSRQELSALRDGSYMLRARVVDEFGQASEEARFAFTVLPPWWRTQGALIGVVLGLVASGYGAYRLRMQALRRRNAELEEKVRRRTRELEAANAAKTQFVANMSHDIRNPLNGIQGMTLALEDMDPTPRQAQAIATLRECATYLTSLVDDVLDFAHIEAGKVELRPRAFVPGELLRSVAATLQADAAAGGARLSIEVGPGLPERLMGDAGRIQQILVNYASNALKYAGGHIRLSAAARTGATGEVEFAVHDDGPGIDLEEQATLFTTFTRLARDRATEIPGSGLGLASCRLLADLMGGAVGVMSQPGAGARFFLRLPIAVATEADATPAFALPNTTVLLVEDTDYNAQAAAAVLARLGLTCERARTGKEALAMFRQKRFNLVLLDRNLPDMDGTEVARQMRATESDGLPAILLAVTAYCTAEDRRLCLEAGMDAFVGKPLTPEKLRRVLLTASRRLLGTASVEAADQRPGFRSPTGFDLSMLTLLADDAERMEDQIDRYLETLDDYARALADAANDPATLVTAAHRLVGHARLIAASALGTAARELEDAARAGQAEDIETLSERTLKEVRATTAALRLYRSPAPSA